MKRETVVSLVDAFERFLDATLKFHDACQADQEDGGVWLGDTLGRECCEAKAALVDALAEAFPEPSTLTITH